MNPVAIFTPVEAVFEDVEGNFPTFRMLLADLSLTDTLFWCARLNLIVSNPLIADHIAKQQYGLNIFFTTEEINKVNLFVREHGGATKVTVFFRGQLLELLRWACLLCEDKSNDGRSFEDPQIRRKFAQALLIAGQLWGQRIYGSRFSLNGGIDLARLRGLGAMRGAMAETSSGINPLQALGRGQILFAEHFPRQYPAFADEFLDITGISVADYYVCLTAMTANFLNRTPELIQKGAVYSGVFDINSYANSVRDELKTLFSKYAYLESQTPQELRGALWGNVELNQLNGSESYELKPLRQRPILRVSDGRAIIMDPVFYTEKATVGPLFFLATSLPKGKVNELFGAFGKTFEAYANEIFERMYPARTGLANRFTKNLKGRDQSGQEIEISDGYLEDVSEAAFFEMKAVWIRDNVILDDNHDLYLDHLKERYGQSSTAQDRIKGYAQIARAIKKISQGQGFPNEVDIFRITRVYPVLLVYDSLLDTPVGCSFLNSEFSALLEPDEILPSGFMRKGQLLVAPLIIMTIDELEALETSVRHFRLLDLFRDYTDQCADRITSLHNFIAATEPYKRQMYANQEVAQRADELLKTTSQKLFPKANPS
ncbi:MAG: hypothetical protein WD688_20215 [Candidatus Binatia bacterium]